MRFNHRYIRWVILLLLEAVAVYFLDAFFPFSISVLGKEYKLFGLPYSLDLVLLTGCFYILGSEIRQISSEKVLSNGWFFLGTGGGLILLTTIFTQRVDFNTRVFESLILNTIEAILGILFTLALSKQIALRTNWLASTLKYIGVASLFILILHVPIQEYWGAKIYFVTNLRAFSILSAFLISIIISLGFYKVFVEHNPIALFLYGRSSTLPKRKEDEPGPEPETAQL
jgi:fucose 4-O-acetylase-like acetyltransferase